MDNQNNEMLTVPYVVHRDAIAHDRWVIKGLAIALIITVLLMFASNAIWLYFWNQYEYTSEEVVADVDSVGSGIANFTGGNGGVVYGAGDSPQNDLAANETDGQ